LERGATQTPRIGQREVAMEEAPLFAQRVGGPKKMRKKRRTGKMVGCCKASVIHRKKFGKRKGGVAGN